MGEPRADDQRENEGVDASALHKSAQVEQG